MLRLQMIGLDSIIAIIFILPILLMNKKWLFAPKKFWYYIIFAFYLSAIYVAVGLPSIIHLRFNLNLNMIPLKGMIVDFKNSILNIILFIPLGIALPLFWTKYHSIKRVTLFSFLLSLSIEILQLFTNRATDVNDLITNTLGSMIGYFVMKYLFKRQTLICSEKGTHDLYILGICVFLVMFFIQPFFSTILWELLYSI